MKKKERIFKSKKFKISIIIGLLLIVAIIMHQTLIISQKKENSISALNEIIENGEIPENEVDEVNQVDKEKLENSVEKSENEILTESTENLKEPEEDFQEDNLEMSTESENQEQSNNSSNSTAENLANSANNSLESEPSLEPNMLASSSESIQTQAKGNIIEYTATINIPSELKVTNNYSIEISNGQYFVTYGSYDLKIHASFDQSSLSIKVGETELKNNTDYNIQDEEISVENYRLKNKITFTDTGKEKIINAGVDNINIKYRLFSENQPIPLEHSNNYGWTHSQMSNKLYYTLSCKLEAKLDENIISSLTGTDIKLSGVHISAWDSEVGRVPSTALDVAHIDGNEYKIALSEEDAAQNKFLKDKNGTDIVLCTEYKTGEVPANSTSSYSKVSWSAQVMGLVYGNYYIVETKVVDGYKRENYIKEVKISESSYMPKSDDRPEYNNCFPYTKVSSDFSIQLQDSLTNEVLINGKFKLQLKGEDGNYADVYNTTKTTDSFGNITWDALKVGEYKVIQIESPRGYKMPSNTEVFNFEVYVNGNTAGKREIKSSGEKVEITGPVIIKNDGFENILSVDFIQSYAKANMISYKTNLEIPQSISTIENFEIEYTSKQYYVYGDKSTYTIYRGIDFLDSSIELSMGDEKLQKDLDYTINETKSSSTNNTILTINLTADGKNKLANYSGNGQAKKYLTINLSIINRTDRDYATLYVDTKIYAFGDENFKCAEKSITTQEGAKSFKKVNATYYPLVGAKFKIANSIEDAKNNNFIKDMYGDDLVFMPDSGFDYGEFYVSGLVYGTYYLVEVQAPVAENGDKYKRLKDPIEFTIDENSYSSTMEIVNDLVKKPTLPEAGGAGVITTAIVGSLLIIIALRMKKENAATVGKQTRNGSAKISKVENRNARRIAELKKSGKLNSRKGKKKNK